jgi:iron complex outermembrane receptor protein
VKLDEILLKSVRVKENGTFTQSTVTKKEIEKRNLGQDIPILLNYLPSVVSTSDAGAGIGYTGIRVRGSDATRVNVTINGIPYNDAESQGTFWVNLPDFASSVENMQLQRGVGTSTNGSGAFGASLNILTESIAESAFAEINSSFGSYNTFKNNVKFSTGLLKDHFELSGRFSLIKSDGYIDRASSDLKSYFLQAAYKNEKTLIKALVFGGHEVTYQAWYGIDAETLKADRRFNFAGIYTDENGETSFYENEVDDYKQDHIQLHWSQKINNYWSTSLGLNYTRGKGFFEQYKEDEDLEEYGLNPSNDNDTDPSVTDLVRRRWLDNDFYVLNALANYSKAGLDLVFGGSYSLYDGDHFGEVIWTQTAGKFEIPAEYYNGNGTKKDLSFYAKATYSINEQWAVFGDLQERFVHYSTSGLTSDQVPLAVDESYAFFNPKIGTTLKIDLSQNIYFSYARANREPNRNDFENGITKPESLNDFELGWRFSNQKTKINANLFYMSYKDQLVLTGELDDVGNPVRATSGESYRFGLELDASIPFLQKWMLIPNLALSTNKNTNFTTYAGGELVSLGKTDIAFSPEIVASNMIVFQPNNKVSLGLLSKFVGQQYMGNIDSEASKLDSYFVHDFNASYQLGNAWIFESLAFNLLVNNIFDVEYVSNGYFYTYDDTWSVPGEITTIETPGYYPQAEVNFLFGITLKF